MLHVEASEPLEGSQTLGGGVKRRHLTLGTEKQDQGPLWAHEAAQIIMFSSSGEKKSKEIRVGGWQGRWAVEGVKKAGVLKG